MTEELVRAAFVVNTTKVTVENAALIEAAVDLILEVNYSMYCKGRLTTEQKELLQKSREQAIHEMEMASERG